MFQANDYIPSSSSTEDTINKTRQSPQSPDPNLLPSQVFQANGYPPRVVQKTLNKTRQSPQTPDPNLLPSQEQDRPKTPIIPYIRGVSEKIERLVKLLKVRTIQKTQSIRQRVIKVKRKPRREEVSGVVYTIPYECGTSYIGETGHTLRLRAQEHRQAVRNCDMNIGIGCCTCHEDATQNPVGRSKSDSDRASTNQEEGEGSPDN